MIYIYIDILYPNIMYPISIYSLIIYYYIYIIINNTFIVMVISGQRRQKSMTNSLFKIRTRAFGVETLASRYGRVIA